MLRPGAGGPGGGGRLGVAGCFDFGTSVGGLVPLNVTTVGPQVLVHQLQTIQVFLSTEQLSGWGEGEGGG